MEAFDCHRFQQNVLESEDIEMKLPQMQSVPNAAKKKRRFHSNWRRANFGKEKLESEKIPGDFFGENVAPSVLE